MQERERKILITGGSGMVGHAFKSIIPGATYVSSKECNLMHRPSTFLLIEHNKPEIIIHLAAKVGGVKANMNYVGNFYSENIAINNNVLDAAKKYNVNKVISLLSTCVYPDKVTYPLTEDQIHGGPPHLSNFGYAYAKRMLDVQSRAYRKQYGCNFITAVPNNLFGENDNFHLEDSHVIPAMVRKIYEAKENNKDVVLWGDGSPLREFTYSGDLAKILLFLLDNYDQEQPINVGNTNEVSIKKVADTLVEILDFKGNIIWDTTKPCGQHRKPSSNKKLLDLGWKKENYTPLDVGLKKLCKWFIINYPSVRGAV